VDRLRIGVCSLSRELPVTRAVLFGSWASGRATAFSDIDILVVYEGRAREDAYGMVRSHIPIRGLEPHVYSEVEAEAVKRTLEQMTRGGVLLLET
jgi:predicted nucleotidyltransferase